MKSLLSGVVLLCLVALAVAQQQGKGVGKDVSGRRRLVLNDTLDSQLYSCTTRFDCEYSPQYEAQARAAVTKLNLHKQNGRVPRSVEQPSSESSRPKRLRSKRQWQLGDAALIYDPNDWWAGGGNLLAAANSAFNGKVNTYGFAEPIANILTATRKVVIVWGGASTTNAAVTFVQNNLAALQNWVENGGSLVQNFGNSETIATGQVGLYGLLKTDVFAGSYMPDVYPDTAAAINYPNLFYGGINNDPPVHVLGSSVSHTQFTLRADFEVLFWGITTGGATRYPVVHRISDTADGLYVAMGFTDPQYTYRPGLSCCGYDNAWSQAVYGDIFLHAVTYTGTCLNNCGTNDGEGGCWCDQWCEANQDCCPDFNQLCTIDAFPPGPQTGLCSTTECGGYGGSCFCDPICSYYGDCCVNKFQVCDNAARSTTYGTYYAHPYALGAGCVTHYNVSQVYDVVKGAAMMASGGGGALSDGIGYVQLMDQYFANNPGKVFSVISSNSSCVAPEGVCVFAQMGNPETLHNWVSGKAPTKLYDMSESMKGVYTNLVSLTGNPCKIVAPIETGAVNTIIPFWVSAVTNTLILDADGGGRAVPTLPQTFWAASTLAQKTTPMVAVSLFNDTTYNPTSPANIKFQPGWGYAFNTLNEVLMNTGMGGPPPWNEATTTWVNMSLPYPYDANVLNDVAFSGIGIFGYLASVGFYPMTTANGRAYGYPTAVTKLPKIALALQSGSLSQLKTAAGACVVGGSVSAGLGRLVQVNSWADAGGHQWQYQVVVLQDNTLVQTLAFNENALAWKSPYDGKTTYAGTTTCSYTTNPVNTLPLAANIVVVAPDPIVLVQVLNNGTLVALSGPDVVNACQAGGAVPIYNMVSPVNQMWAGGICKPLVPATQCQTSVPAGYECFCSQTNVWYTTIFNGLFAANPAWAGYAWPYYKPIPAGICT